jgi:hypothetical protein
MLYDNPIIYDIYDSCIRDIRKFQFGVGVDYKRKRFLLAHSYLRTSSQRYALSISCYKDTKENSNFQIKFEFSFEIIFISLNLQCFQ